MSGIKDIFTGAAGGGPKSALNPARDRAVGIDMTNQAYGQTQSGLNQIQGYNNQIAAAQPDVFAQQQALANQLQGVANGQGPNPALAQLNQTTGQNINNQGALMASQRGAGANPGLIARQAAMQGGNIQQQAAGQAATLGAQQQLAGMGALQNQLGMQANQRYQGLGLYNQAAQNEQNNLMGSLNNYLGIDAGMRANVNNANAGILNNSLNATSGFLQGSGSAASSFIPKGARGGEVVQRYEMGGAVDSTPATGWGSFSEYLNKPNAQNSLPDSIGKDTQGQWVSGPGQPSLLKSASSGAAMAMMASKGAMVPGKASIKGDSYKNDTVKALLSPGEVVIPRHIMQSKDPVNNSARFVQAILAKKHKGSKS